ncbi:MAG: ArsA-related P-loop ATPase [Deltaproteobacteria bacterium]|nr:ArsA-related P-loop ATPase [Deltaproteobacteria bacterium]
MANSSLSDLLTSHRVIVTVGSGGVGKTTTAAAIALAGARAGRRVLCLTIDPAKRLATSLGLGSMSHEAQKIDSAVLGLAPDSKGSLTAMMLDVRRTFDELVTRYAQTPEARDRILSNSIYQQIASSLAGTPEYMAMEKLYALKDDPQYDLIVLDTPPTSNALDFLEAPDKMVAAMDSPTIRAFVSAFEKGGSMSLKLLSKAMAQVLQGLSKFTGAGFLEQIAGFLTDLQSMFGGFKERALKVREQLKSKSVAFVIVSSPEPMAVTESLFFAEKLVEGGMHLEAVVFNRVRRVDPVDVSSPQRIANILREADIEQPVELAAGILKAYHDASVWSRRDAGEIVRARRELPLVPRFIEVPAFDEDVYDLRALTRVANYVAPA